MRSLIPSQWSPSWMRNLPAQSGRDPFALLHQEMNRLFDTFGGLAENAFGDNMSPRIDVSETDKEIDIDAELPGIDEKDLDITLAGDVVTIRGEKRSEREQKNKNYYVSERSYGSFARSIPLPFDADPKNVSAKFDKGVLHIAIPKPEQIAAKTTKIPVKAA